MATNQPAPAAEKPKPIKITNTGAPASGKSCLAQWIAGVLKLHGHDVIVVEKLNGERYIVNEPQRVKEFRDPREIRIEVKLPAA